MQSFSFYAIDLEGESGPIAAILIVTELESIHAFVDVDESELAFATRRRDERELRMKEPEREIWVTHALRERQNQAPGDQVVALDGSDALVLGTATVAFGPADSDELILLVDLDDLLSWPYETAKYDFDEVFIDDFMVTASDGPLRDDSAEMRALTELSERKGYDVQTLRREPVTDSGALILLVLAYFALGAAAIRIAFGPVRRRRGADLANAEPAAELPQG